MLNVLGQSRAIAQLQRSIAAGRLAHTWLFSGPPMVLFGSTVLPQACA